MKAKRRSRGKYRSCWISIIVLLALVAVSAVFFTAQARFCAIPTEKSLSQGFIRSVLRSERSEAEIVQHIYDELSWKLAWHGTGMLGWIYFTNTCQGDDCNLDYLYMEMIVKVFDLCMFNRRVWFTTVNTTIDFNEPKVEVEVFHATMWAWPIPIETAENEISLEVSRVKERAIGSIESSVWETYSTLSLKFSRSVDSWSASVYTPSEELIKSVQVGLYDYQIIKEEQQ